MLYNANEQLKNEKQRADDANRKALEAAHLFRNAENARILAEQNAKRADEVRPFIAMLLTQWLTYQKELRLYKVQLDNAQKEIYRAQEVLSTVDHQRQQAEEDAARARTTARALKEEKLIQMAREDGRRSGMEEGIQRGRDLGYEEGRAAGYEQGRSTADDIMDRLLSNEQRSIPLTQIHYSSSPPSPQHPQPPPDNWIPEQDDDSRIRLPPPHEMAHPPLSRSPSPSLSSLREGDAHSSPALMIPAPNQRSMEYEYASDAPRHPTRSHRRTSSVTSESSTRTSELDLLHVPQRYATRGYDGDNLSIIHEGNSAEGTPSQITMKTSSSPVTVPTPSIRQVSVTVLKCSLETYVSDMCRPPPQGRRTHPKLVQRITTIALLLRLQNPRADHQVIRAP